MAIICPGCLLELPDRHLDPPCRFKASGECWLAFSDLSCYMVAKGDAAFIHQHAVDAYEAQHAGGNSRPITAVFGLIGLYLALEKGYTGRHGSGRQPAGWWTGGPGNNKAHGRAGPVPSRGYAGFRVQNSKTHRLSAI